MERAWLHEAASWQSSPRSRPVIDGCDGKGYVRSMIRRVFERTWFVVCAAMTAVFASSCGGSGPQGPETSAGHDSASSGLSAAPAACATPAAEARPPTRASDESTAPSTAHAATAGPVASGIPPAQLPASPAASAGANLASRPKWQIECQHFRHAEKLRVGLTIDEASALFGPPDSSLRKGTSLVWRYRSPNGEDRMMNLRFKDGRATDISCGVVNADRW
jgi:hypothetical protein